MSRKFNINKEWYNPTLSMLRWYEKPRWWFKPKRKTSDSGVTVVTKYDEKRGKTLVIEVRDDQNRDGQGTGDIRPPV